MLEEELESLLDKQNKNSLKEKSGLLKMYSNQWSCYPQSKELKSVKYVLYLSLFSIFER